MKKKILILFAVIISFLFSISILHAEMKKISGPAYVVDGDTIKINGKKIRLSGIDAPEIKQKCKKPYLQIMFFTFQKDYYCGQISKKKLVQKIENKQVQCIISGNDRYKRYLATCLKGKINLNRWMVRNGYALAYRRYSKLYILDENFAKEEKLGLWSGTFTKPEKWRKLN